MIEVRYAGAVVGRSAIVRELDTRGLFLGITEPMPVGTDVALKIGDELVSGKVAAVSESQELSRAGMRVTFLDAASAALFGTPAEAPPEAPPESLPPERVKAAASEITVVGGPDAPVRSRSDAGGGTAGDDAVPKPESSPASGGHRRIIVDASSDHPPADAPSDESDASGPVAPGAASSGPAGPGDGKKNRRNKRR